MSKFTRNIKRKTRKNKTIKIGGAKSVSGDHKRREGIIDSVNNKLSGIASSAYETVRDTGLRFAGLQVIPKHNEEKSIVDQTSQTTLDEQKTSGPSVLATAADKTGTAILNDINDVLSSSQVVGNTQQAAKDTAEIIKKGSQMFNEALSDPAVQEELKESIEKAGEIGSLIIDAGKEPFNKAVDVAAEASQKATGAALSGAIKVGTDALGAVPFVGAIIDVGKMLNDGSRAASAVVEAGSEATEAASDAFIETTKNLENKLRELEEKKRLGDDISNRTTESINQFENNTATSGEETGRNKMVGGSGHKTTRRLLKRKCKSKRVRFAL